MIGKPSNLKIAISGMGIGMYLPSKIPRRINPKARMGGWTNL
jgi:hypothetical protein